MCFSLRHLLAFVTLFAISLAAGLPGAHMVPDGIWKVTSLYEEENGGIWHGEDPSTGEPSDRVGMDYIITIRDGLRSRRVNLGDTNYVWNHQLPAIGGYVVLQESKMESRATLPVTVIDELPFYTVTIGVISSLLLSALLVCSLVGAHRLIHRFRAEPKAT